MIIPNTLMLELERLITYAFDNEAGFINEFFPDTGPDWSLERCYLASERTEIALIHDDGSLIETTIPTLNFISWVNGNL